MSLDEPEIPEMLNDNLTYHSGYGAHVILGEKYQLKFNSTEIDGTDSYFKLYDLYPGDKTKTAEIELELCIDVNCETCTLTKDNRKWITNQGVDEKAEQNDCGELYNNLRS